MAPGKGQTLATELSVAAVRLVRWLRATDVAPALSGPEASAMAVIVHAGRVTPSRLAELEQVRRPTISRLVDGLVDRGLVRRDPHPTDRRGVVLAATDAGRTLWLSGQARITAPLAARIDTLTPDERVQLAAAVALLGRLTEPPID